MRGHRKHAHSGRIVPHDLGRVEDDRPQIGQEKVLRVRLLLIAKLDVVVQSDGVCGRHALPLHGGGGQNLRGEKRVQMWGLAKIGMMEAKTS